MKMSKKMLSIILALVIAITCVIPVFADTYATSGTCGENVTWEFDVPTRTLTISGEGEMYDYSDDTYDTVPWSTYREIIKNVVIESGVITIGDYVFYAHSALTDISISDTVTTIGRYAFGYCSVLTSIAIPDSVTYIDFRAFEDCSSLKQLTVGKGVSYIYSGVFSGCSSLSDVYISDLSSWCNIVFKNAYSNPFYYAENLYLNGVLVTELVIPNDITTVNSYSFYSCDSIDNVTIGDNVASIGSYAFYNCDSIENVTIGNNVTSIDSYAFSDCNNLLNVTLGNNVATISDFVFSNCDNLLTIYIPQNVTSINGSAFIGCDSLSEVNVDESNEYFKSIDGVLFSENMIALLVYPSAKNKETYTIPENVLIVEDLAFYNNDYLKNVTIPDTVATIGNYSFSGCGSLVEIVIPDEVVSIGSSVFSSCDKLENITIGKGIKEISSHMFYNCDSLTGIVIPEGVTSICDSAFSSCSNLLKVTIPDSVTVIGYNVFTSCSNLETVILGSGMSELPTYAFDNKERIDNLYYNGSEDDLAWSRDYYERWFKYIHFNCTNPDGHYTLTKVVNPSTCADEGYSEYTCPCGYTIKKDYTYLDHTPGEWNISQYPTCTKTGYKYQRCTGCGVWLNDESIPATGHIAGEWQSIAPTCTESGLEGKCCTECGELIEGEIVAALGGSHTFGEWTMVDNRQSRTCSTCGYIEYMKVAGDLNGDGYTSAKEARIILQCVAGLIDIESELKDTADVNYDGKISAVDARIVLQMVAGLREPEDGWNIISYDKSTIDPDAPAVSSLTVSTDKTSVIVGEIVFVTVTLDNKSGISALTTIANYDSSILKPIEMKAGNLGATVNVNTGVATMAAAETFETSGTICTMTFQALKTGSADITFDIIEACDSDMSDVNLNVNTVKITVGEESTTEPEEPSIEPGTCANGHNYTWYTISVVTCETDGVMLGECTVCGATDVKATLKTGHNIVDGVCQNCGYTENGENDNTNTDDNENVGNEDNNNEEVTDPSENCSCNCHKSGISNFFFKIGLFFQKIFGSNKYCGCGVAHY